MTPPDDVDEDGSMQMLAMAIAFALLVFVILALFYLVSLL